MKRWPARSSASRRDYTEYAPSARRQSRARAGVPEGRSRNDAGDEALAAHSQAVHARHRQPGRRGHPRRFRPPARPQQLHHLRQRVRQVRPRPLPRQRVPRRVSRPVHPAKADAANPDVPLRGRVRRLDQGRVQEAGRRRPAGDPRRVDPLQRRDRDQDQAQRLRPGVGRRSRGGHRPRHDGRPGKRGVRDWVYSIDFNERCPNIQYVLDFIHQIKEKAPAAFERIQYLEQPTARDLARTGRTRCSRQPSCGPS